MTRRFTKADHYRAVALVLSGCSKSGVARLFDMAPNQLRQLLRSPAMREQIDAHAGGEEGFKAEYANPQEVADLKYRAANGHAFQPKPAGKPQRIDKATSDRLLGRNQTPAPLKKFW